MVDGSDGSNIAVVRISSFPPFRIHLAVTRVGATWGGVVDIAPLHAMASKQKQHCLHVAITPRGTRKRADGAVASHGRPSARRVTGFAMITHRSLKTSFSERRSFTTNFGEDELAPDLQNRALHFFRGKGLNPRLHCITTKSSIHYKRFNQKAHGGNSRGAASAKQG